jgi:hypothetical protein
MSVFPENFDPLAGGEEKIRQLSKAASHLGFSADGLNNLSPFT